MILNVVFCHEESPVYGKSCIKRRKKHEKG